MKMRKQKKGFTITELVIVIAVIAVLAAVLIPTFVSLVRRANESKDIQLVHNLNTALTIDGEKHETMQSALDAALESGYDVDKINASATDNEILWDSKNNLFCYLKGDKVEYIPDSNIKDEIAENEQYLYWKISDKVDETYSVYYTGNEKSITTSVGFDVGKSTSVEEITYSNTSGAAKSVVIRTNGGKLNINGLNGENGDTVYHYGELGLLIINSCGNNSYHEYGEFNSAKVNDGRMVLEREAASSVVYVAANSAVIAYKDENGLPVISRGSEVNEFKMQSLNSNNEVVAEKTYAIVGENVTVNGNAVTGDVIAESIKTAVAEKDAEKAMYFGSIKAKLKGDKKKKDHYYETQESLFDAIIESNITTAVEVTLLKPRAAVVVPANVNINIKDVQSAVSIVNYGTLTLKVPSSNNANCDAKTIENYGTLTVSNGTYDAKFINHGTLKLSASAILSDKVSFEGENINLAGVMVTEACMQKGSLDKYLKDGEAIYLSRKNNGEDKYTVINTNNSSLAKVDDHYFTDLSIALKYSDTDNYVTLLSDFTMKDNMSISKKYYLDLNGYNINFANGKLISIKTDGVLFVKGSGKIKGSTAENASLVQIQGSLANYIEMEGGSYYVAFDMGENVTLENATGYGIGIVDYNLSKNSGHSDGIIVNIAGTIKASAGITISGVIKNEENCSYAPVINIKSTAVLDCTDTAIYAAGYGDWTIDGTVKGITGIELRAGKLTVNDGAVIEGTYSRLVPDENGSGTTTKGAGLAVIQHETRLKIEVIVNGGTISGFVGLYEGNPQSNPAEALQKITITVNDGTIKSTNSDNGNAIQITDSGINVTVSETVNLEGNKVLAA